MSAIFATPDHVAEQLGLPRTTVRRLAKQHGTYTEAERRRMVFTEQNIEDLIRAIASPARPQQDQQAEDFDPFAPTPRA